MSFTIKALAEALAELFGIDETDALSRLLEKGITNYGEFQRYVQEMQRLNIPWKPRGY